MITDYIRPTTVAEALKVRSERENAFWYAGGTRINNAEYGLRSGTAVSLELLGLHEIVSTDDDLVLGAMVRLQELVESAELPQVLRSAAAQVYSRNVRNMATVGGNIAAATPDSVLNPLLLACDSELQLAGNGPVLLSQYLQQRMDDLILSVRIPACRRPAAVRKITRSSASPALVTAAAVLTLGGGKVAEAGVVLGGLQLLPVRLESIEKQLVAGTIQPGRALQKAVEAEVDVLEDYRCSVAYKRYIAGVIADECIAECLGGVR